MVLVGAVYVLLTAHTAQRYYQETEQKLNRHIAEQIVKDVKPIQDGEVNEKALKELFHYLMVIHPQVEVYLLDEKGKILTYYAPKAKVRADRVPLGRIERFIEKDSLKGIMKGMDPRHPEKKKIFSAAPIEQRGRTRGYIYVILASEDQRTAAQTLFDHYVFRSMAPAFLIAIALALLLGVAAFWFLTRRIGRLRRTLGRFEEGDLEARVPIKSKDEIGSLERSFNRMASNLKANFDKIERMESSRKALIANVSHDLRTPLTSMQGYVETLALKGDDLALEKRKDYAEKALEHTDQLKHLVDELFELSKLESGRLEPDPEPFFINELVQDISHKYEAKASEKGIRLQPILSNELPPVHGDVRMIDRVLQNLLDNALKHSPEGGTVSIELSERDKGIEVKVSDTGPGIPEEEQARVFERYKVGKSRNGQGTNGSGLGLAIVHQMLQVQGMDIQLHSKVGKGSSFSFTIPYYQD